MARKGYRQKLRKGVSESGSALLNENGNTSLSEAEGINAEEPLSVNLSGISLTESLNNSHDGEGKKKSKNKSRRALQKEKEDTIALSTEEEKGPEGSGAGVFQCDKSRGVAPESREGGKTSPLSSRCSNSKRSFGRLGTGVGRDTTLENFRVSVMVVFRNLLTLARSVSKASVEQLERWKPFLTLVTGYIQEKVRYAYPIVVGWIIHFGNIMLLLSMVWLDCALRGIGSFLGMGMTSVLSVIWWGVLSLIAATKFKFLLILAAVAVIGLLTGFIIAVLGIAAVSISYLWFYQRFWLALLLVLSGGALYRLKHERLSLFVVTLYSVYCTWIYVGWIGLIFGLNLSFISTDILIYFLRNNLNEQRTPNNSPDQTTGAQGEPSFYPGGSVPPTADDGCAHPADHGTGIPSTSGGSDAEMTSEDEVLRLLNSTDHYSALGLSRFQNVDPSVLKREYRKKAMLVHPDKNMGNEKAAEAFKKLQNSYEVLLDSLKRKAYDDELRREDLLNYIRRFQSPDKSSGYGFFTSGFTQTEVAGEAPLAEARRIMCKKCGNFHVWAVTKKSKSKARWCQDCKDFHPAKDGDGWVEQPSHPFFFGMLLKVDNPVAYVCADSKIYNATEWYICQGMRCPANSHKPSFHVNTSVTLRNSNGKRSSSGPRPMPNMEETMTEDEFVEWLQNAVQTGMFGDFDGSTAQNPSTGSTSKSNSSNPSGSGNKRKKKGKKQW